ncbi:MAG TPA: hypothetical protein VLG12_05825 [Candidatus Saccharimonadales bacterium]|nr:hypothetical protein [Candidatus Saccharimonadales bacterium]
MQKEAGSTFTFSNIPQILDKKIQQGLMQVDFLNTVQTETSTPEWARTADWHTANVSQYVASAGQYFEAGLPTKQPLQRALDHLEFAHSRSREQQLEQTTSEIVKIALKTQQADLLLEENNFSTLYNHCGNEVLTELIAYGQTRYTEGEEEQQFLDYVFHRYGTYAERRLTNEKPRQRKESSPELLLGYESFIQPLQEAGLDIRMPIQKAINTLQYLQPDNFHYSGEKASHTGERTLALVQTILEKGYADLLLENEDNLKIILTQSEAKYLPHVVNAFISNGKKEISKKILNLTFYNDSQKCMTKYISPDNRAITSRYFSYLHERWGDMETANTLREESADSYLKFFEECDNKGYNDGIFYQLLNLARVHSQFGNADTALYFLQRAEGRRDFSLFKAAQLFDSKDEKRILEGTFAIKSMYWNLYSSTVVALVLGEKSYMEVLIAKSNSQIYQASVPPEERNTYQRLLKDMLDTVTQNPDLLIKRELVNCYGNPYDWDRLPHLITKP